MKLKEMLRLQLKEKGITATALSKKSGVPLQTLNNWLAGTKPRDFNQVKATADILGVTLDYLVYGNEVKNLKPEDLVSFGSFDVFLRRNK